MTGQYLYLEIKSPHAGTPFSFHFDFGVAERAHNVRVSISNLFKSFNTSNGFVIQVPLELKTETWTIVVIDLNELLRRS